MTSFLVNKKLTSTDVLKINLCSGSRLAEGYVNIDISANADIVLDLEEKLLPFEDNTADVVVCMSAINYFTYKRAAEIIKDVHRVLKPGGITRFGTQDLRILTEKYVNRDTGFFFQKLQDGRERFPGKTMADKLNEWFYGFAAGGKCCKYVYDYDSLKCLFENVGFEQIEQKEFCQSSIPEISELDNRPEQMFFLEAVKSCSDQVEFADTADGTYEQFSGAADITMMRNHAIDLWESGCREEAWQLLMKILELKPDDRKTATKCARILKSLSRYQDLENMCSEYLQVSNDREISELLSFAKEQLDRIEQEDLEKTQQMQKKLRLSNYYNTILPDQTHLAGCLQWLERAQKINDGNGVASMYRMDLKRWEVDYPETTGYIIPTFIGYHKITGLQSYLDKAKQMGDWEISIQWPEGGIGEPVGVYGYRPRIFNTSQVILGWLALFKQTGLEKYLKTAQQAGDWIVDLQDSDGKWSENTYAGPKAYHIRVAWPLCELYAVTGDDKYRIAAEKSVRWVLSQTCDNGWFDNNSLSEQGKPWTHLIGYALVGLLEVYRLNNITFDKQRADVVLINAARNIAKYYFQSKQNNQNANLITLPGTFDRNWSSSDQWSCLTGNAQIEFFLRKISGYTGESAFKVAANMLIDDLKQLHLMDDINDVDVIGGLAGSFPIEGQYSNYAIPNWGVKFFADCLIQRVLGVDKQEMLG